MLSAGPRARRDRIAEICYVTTTSLAEGRRNYSDMEGRWSGTPRLAFVRLLSGSKNHQPRAAIARRGRRLAPQGHGGRRGTPPQGADGRGDARGWAIGFGSCSTTYGICCPARFTPEARQFTGLFDRARLLGGKVPSAKSYEQGGSKEYGAQTWLDSDSRGDQFL